MFCQWIFCVCVEVSKEFSLAAFDVKAKKKAEFKPNTFQGVSYQQRKYL